MRREEANPDLLGCRLQYDRTRALSGRIDTPEAGKSASQGTLDPLQFYSSGDAHVPKLGAWFRDWFNRGQDAEKARKRYPRNVPSNQPTASHINSSLFYSIGTQVGIGGVDPRESGHLHTMSQCSSCRGLPQSYPAPPPRSQPRERPFLRNKRAIFGSIPKHHHLSWSSVRSNSPHLRQLISSYVTY